MEFAFIILSCFFISGALLPLIRNQHWFFRMFDFGKAQLLVLHLLVFIAAFFLLDFNWLFLLFQSLNLVIIAYHTYVLRKYTPFYKLKSESEKPAQASAPINLLSVNVYQFNKHYDLLLKLVKAVKPQLVLTIESNKDWEQALEAIESDYPYCKKVPQENTYGMHLYSKLPLENVKVHYPVADDLPSIEAVVKSPEGIRFTLFCVHPPPPSPSEEPNSKERDGDILSIARLAKKTKYPVVVVGDFNNVAWARSSVLFKKVSGLLDARIGRGFVSTFHAKYRFLRIPIDLFFHSRNVVVEGLKTLKPINSDHLPLYSTFYIAKEKVEDESETLTQDDQEEVSEKIEEGIKEEGDRPEVNTED
jgi:endonuclease/exonuclease/phosphatase (EEP) superfamily protein YafD